jgi:arabinogalactan endo-1,4-beta-galactosidase
MNRILSIQFLFLLLIAGHSLTGQPFYFGADLSYVNEMEDCGVVYKENDAPKDPYQIFADHNCNLVRLRLWHMPSWYDNLNSGNRYSDFADVRRSIMRAKAAGMHVLLDFHLSDNWADPSKQVIPAAWLDVVDDLPALKDSLYNYISSVLLQLDSEGLLPEMVQIGNETNRGILLSPEQNAAGWTLDWNRNSQLFNRAIEAVRDVETATGKSIEVALHLAGPADTGWFVQGFVNNGVTDFDIIGMSYYWAWHKPTTIAQTGQTITALQQSHPGKKVMIFETGYIWTTAGNDNANNIITETHPDYHPASPANQKEWLVDLTQEVINRGGAGVVYWEPAWVSSSCWTQWGQGSHQEHATFFDFNNNLLADGGVGFMTWPYDNLSKLPAAHAGWRIKVYPDSSHRNLFLEFDKTAGAGVIVIHLANAEGKSLLTRQLELTGDERESLQTALPDLPPGMYFLTIRKENRLVGQEKIWLHQK